VVCTPAYTSRVLQQMLLFMQHLNCRMSACNSVCCRKFDGVDARLADLCLPVRITHRRRALQRMSWQARAGAAKQVGHFAYSTAARCRLCSLCWCWHSKHSLGCKATFKHAVCMPCCGTESKGRLESESESKSLQWHSTGHSWVALRECVGHATQPLVDCIHRLCR
jgi:hypothetical protein